MLRRIFCFFLFCLIFSSAAFAEEPRVLWYDDEAARAEATNDSWMSLESDTEQSLNDGWEYHIWTQYYGTDAITHEVQGVEIDMNGVRVYECEGFFMDCHVPYETWFSLLKNNQITMTITFHTVYGDSPAILILEYRKDAPALCAEHTWKVNREMEIFAPCQSDPSRHYLKEAYYDRECSVCGFTQRNEILNYGETDSPRIERHTYGADGICTAQGCGAERTATTPAEKMEAQLEAIQEGKLRAFQQDTTNAGTYNNLEDKPEFSKTLGEMPFGSSTMKQSGCGLFSLMNIEQYDCGATFSLEDLEAINKAMNGKTTYDGLDLVAPVTDKINYVKAEGKSWIYVDNKKAEDREKHIEAMQQWLQEPGQYAIISTTNKNIRTATNDGPHFIAVLGYDSENDRFLIADSASMYLGQTYHYERINDSTGAYTGFAWVTTDQLKSWTNLAINLMERQPETRQ